ncbi:nucleotidyltransferase family protein [Citricoccus sp. NR2]|uniref:nucleotidyltransferase family protein n=1 Tax=Citricoccus sp. NR2 TaxID=3004095 RepID=UPI0022DD75E9|nr:nucleotidyltransferase domain-containing protein [Citricoccus sp. NR2]WBL20056.1 nucleotidyltransferase domain-containing protein [Citricoccus sp. NR2]
MGMTSALPRSVLRERRSALIEVLRRFHVTRAGVFGSAARGEDTADSDIDLVVDFAPGADKDLIRLSEQLSAAAGVPVDVVDAQTVYQRAKETGIGTTILRDTVPL